MLLFGNPGQLLVQGAAILAAIVYSGAMSFVLLKLIGLVIPLRATADDESRGLDISLHGEDAYPQSEGGVRRAWECSWRIRPTFAGKSSWMPSGRRRRPKKRGGPLLRKCPFSQKDGPAPFRNSTGPRGTR